MAVDTCALGQRQYIVERGKFPRLTPQRIEDRGDQGIGLRAVVSHQQRGSQQAQRVDLLAS